MTTRSQEEDHTMPSSSSPPTTETLIQSTAVPVKEERPADSDAGEIEETSPNPPPRKTVRTKVPEVEINLFRCGKGPIAVFRSGLGGWDQDQLEVRDILEKYGLKSLFAFSPDSATRGVPIRFSQKNGRSILTYKDGSIIYVDGEPTVSLRFPVSCYLGFNSDCILTLKQSLINDRFEYG